MSKLLIWVYSLLKRHSVLALLLLGIFSFVFNYFAANYGESQRLETLTRMSQLEAKVDQNFRDSVHQTQTAFGFGFAQMRIIATTLEGRVNKDYERQLRLTAYCQKARCNIPADMLIAEPKPEYEPIDKLHGDMQKLILGNSLDSIKGTVEEN